MGRKQTVNLLELDLIACFSTKKTHYDVYRDKWGKFYCRVDGKVTQKSLNAKEIVRWFANMMEGK